MEVPTQEKVSNRSKDAELRIRKTSPMARAPWPVASTSVFYFVSLRFFQGEKLSLLLLVLLTSKGCNENPMRGYLCSPHFLRG